MKTNIRRFKSLLGGFAVCAALAGSTARAQYLTDPNAVYGEAPPMHQPGFATALPSGALDGPIWIGYTPTSDGLGYRNGYTTIGGLAPFWSPSGDAHWFVETQGHVSDEGNFFGNIGVGRRIYEHSIRRSFGWSLWYDYDGDQYENFGHDFHQGGISLESYGDHLDFHINGYIPFRDGYTLGDGTPCFIDNRIILNQAIDVALRGGDAEVGTRIPWLPALDLRGYIGGYSYTSDSVDPFLGISGRLESHPAEYVSMQLRVTNDERFGTNAMFGFELHLGGRRHRNAYERMAEPVHRNDHIVRFHEDPIFAVNPATGLPYNVVHVNNSAALSGIGTTELPFNSLALAQMTSAPNDVILVSGNVDASGNPAAYTGGIVLKDNQQLIGAGMTLVIRNGALVAINPPTNAVAPGLLLDPQLATGIPIGNQSLTEFRLLSATDLILPGDIVVCDIPGDKPTITNPGGAAVTLANNNTVAGLNLINSQYGILGNGVNNFNLNNNMISGNVQGGIDVQNASGIGRVVNNMIVDNNRPNPPTAVGQPWANGVEVTVSGADSLDLRIAGNTINDNDTGIRLASTTSGVVNADIVDNLINQNVNDGVNILQAGPGTMNVAVRRTGIVIDPNTGAAPIDPVTMMPVIIQSAQINGNGSLDKIVDTNGNGRAIFSDVLDGNFNMLVENLPLLNNDSSFFPRYGALQFNLEPGVDSAFVRITGNTIQGTGLHGLGPNGEADGFIDAGSGIRIVSNPGLGVTHRFEILNNTIATNFGDGIKLLMLTEGLRTAAIPEGTLVTLIQGNTITGNVGILDDNGQNVTGGITNVTGTDIVDDYDSPGNAFPYPTGFFSNPDPKNEFWENINGSGIVVRAKGTDTSVFQLGILDNQITNNWFDSINIALAGRGNIDFVPSPTPPPPGVFPPVPLTPVRIYEPVIRDPITNFPIASALSPDTFGVNAQIVIDNNRIGNAAPLNDPTAAQSFDDAIKLTMLDGAKAQLRISNNLFVGGNSFPNSPVLPPNTDLLSGRPSIVIPLNAPNAPPVDPAYATAIEIDTWDTTRLALVIDNNDITAPRDPDGDIGPHWRDGGIAISSHENSILATRITRNRISEVLDQNTDFTDIFTTRPTPLSGAAINLFAEGNSTMVAFVNNNDMENRNRVNDGTPTSTGEVDTNAYFEATTADNASLTLQLLDNNAEQGLSPQLSHTVGLNNDAFYLVQTENSNFEIEPTRNTNHERTLPENLSIQTAVLAFVGGGPVLPTSDQVQYGNVAAGTAETRVRELIPFGFPFDVGYPSLFNFDPPVIHP